MCFFCSLRYLTLYNWSCRIFFSCYLITQFSFLWVSFFFFFLSLFRFRSITEQYYRKADGILAMYDITQSSSFAAVRGWIDSVKVSRWRCHGLKNMQNSLPQFEYTCRWLSLLFLFDTCVDNVVSFLTIDVFFDSVFNTNKSVFKCLHQEKMCEGAVLMLLANKLDLADSHSREVSTGEGQRLAEVRHTQIFRSDLLTLLRMDHCLWKKCIKMLFFTSWFLQQHQALFYECSAKTGCNMEELMTYLAGYGILFLFVSAVLTFCLYT